MLAPLYPLLRAPLFCIDAEKAHHLTLSLLHLMHRVGISKLLNSRPVYAPRTVMGLHFNNPVGLAAGFDKTGAYIDALAALGFGFIEVGTVTPRAQPGHARPRLFRLPQAYALINSMGFNNDGVDSLIRHLHHSQVAHSKSTQSQCVLGVNIGKNADTPIERAVEDYLYCFKRVYPFASYITINISSPNTPNLRELQNAEALDTLLAQLKMEQKRLADLQGHYVPLVLKISPDLRDEQIKSIADKLLRYRIDGLIATNTTCARTAVAGLKYAKKVGGLSGQPVFDASNAILRKFRAEVGQAVAIIGVGGIFSAEDAQEKLAAGASLVQLYTGLIYRGPALIRACARICKADGEC